MTATPTPLPGMPEPPVADYETWVAAVHPAFEQAAARPGTFTAYGVVRDAGLPEPPNPAHHWGRLLGLLRDEGWIRPAGWAASDRPTTRHSGVRTWRGTPAARKKAAA